MRRAVTAERAELLRKATAASVLDHLRAAGGGVPSHLLALGLAEALTAMLGHVNVKHRPDVIVRCRLALDMAERRSTVTNVTVQKRGGPAATETNVSVHRSAAVTR